MDVEIKTFDEIIENLFDKRLDVSTIKYLQKLETLNAEFVLCDYPYEKIEVARRIAKVTSAYETLKMSLNQLRDLLLNEGKRSIENAEKFLDDTIEGKPIENFRMYPEDDVTEPKPNE